MQKRSVDAGSISGLQLIDDTRRGGTAMPAESGGSAVHEAEGSEWAELGAPSSELGGQFDPAEIDGNRASGGPE